MEGLPPGFRFHPTDEELITCYLSHKISDASFTSKAIIDVDLNKCEPWDLPDKASMGEKEWYFFNLRDRKYPTGLRTNRATEAGYWKTTGKDKEIFRGDILVGMKKTLVFYKGRAPRGEKSNWVMHEYRLENKHPYRPSKEEWVVCRVFQKNSAAKKPQQAPSTSQLSLDSPCDTNSIVNEFGDFDLPNLNNIAASSGGISHFLPQSQNVDNTYNNMMNLSATDATRNAANYPSLSWPSNLVNSNLSMNSLLLKALQLRSYQTRDTTSSMDYSLIPQNMSSIGTDIALNFQGSTSRVMDSGMTQQQQEQEFNLDSMW